MNKYVLGIKGMRCGMCEMHVEDAIRKNIAIKKVKASHIKNNLVVITELVLTLDDFHKVLDPTGYEIVEYKKEKAIKKLFGWR
ncbi:MAG: heavy-metal-associated domain-containing protein [Bacilli bacterium]|nr:heavy-metal-associated domain-containing protein [Bacilli bacterium]